MNLIMFCYNFMRTKNILGFQKMIETINNWQPDYSKIVCALKSVFISVILKRSEPGKYLHLSTKSFFYAA